MTSPLPPNHHAGHRGFSGPLGVLAGLTMILGRGALARLVADLAEVTADDHVVDVGCGPGTAVREAARRGASATGVDPASPMLRLARLLTREEPAISWVDGRAEALPIPEASATVVWSLSSMHHWPDIDGGLSEARRVLAPGGRLVLTERRTEPRATGLASHGWTGGQAEDVCGRLRGAGFADVGLRTWTPGRHPVLVIQAVRA